jgi:outer membrane lipoprotein-sorting protein
MLARIADAYNAITDYRVEARSKVTSDRSLDPPTKARYILIASKPRCRLSRERISSPIRYDLILGSDGDKVWGYTPQTKKYVVDSATGGHSEELAALRDRHFRYFRRFETLDRIGAVAEIAGSQVLSDGHEKVRCTALRLRPGSRGDWTEEIWVSPKYLVLKSIFRKKTLFETVTTRTTWRIVQINGEIDPALFQFATPSNAMRTNALEIR